MGLASYWFHRWERQLDERSYERIGLLGTSLGSCLSMLTATHEPLVKAMALNHASPWFANVVWEGLSTAHVRAGMEGHIDLPRLREIWGADQPAVLPAPDCEQAFPARVCTLQIRRGGAIHRARPADTQPTGT